MKNLDLNKIKTDEKSYKNIPIYYGGYVTPNHLNDNVSDDYLITLTISMIIFVKFVFYEDNKYYPQVSLDECFYRL